VLNVFNSESSQKMGQPPLWPVHHTPNRRMERACCTAEMGEPQARDQGREEPHHWQVSLTQTICSGGLGGISLGMLLWHLGP
jgi:hypothetical protein